MEPTHAGAPWREALAQRTDEVSNDGRIARVVLRDALLDLPHEVGTHVRRLGVDAAAELGRGSCVVCRVMSGYDRPDENTYRTRSLHIHPPNRRRTYLHEERHEARAHAVADHHERHLPRVHDAAGNKEEVQADVKRRDAGHAQGAVCKKKQSGMRCYCIRPVPA